MTLSSATDLRDVISDWLQRPTIVAISHLVKDVTSSILPVNEFVESSNGFSTIANYELSHGESTTVGVIVICPTNLDCRVLAEAGVINLHHGDTIIVEGNNDDNSERSKKLGRSDKMQWLNYQLFL